MTTVNVAVEVCTGISEPLVLRGFEVFPNPNDGRFSVRLHLLRDQDVQLEVRDALGRIVQAERFAANSGQVDRALDLSGSPAGVYTLTMHVQGRQFMRRVVVE